MPKEETAKFKASKAKTLPRQLSFFFLHRKANRASHDRRLASTTAMCCHESKGLVGSGEQLFLVGSFSFVGSSSVRAMREKCRFIGYMIDDS